MAEQRLRRMKMVENRSRLFNFCFTSGRDLFQDVLELETSPALVYEMLLTSDYYKTLFQSERDLYLSLKTKNTFSELELEHVFVLLIRFTSVKQPKCLWCGKCPVETIQSDSIEDSLELVMSIWNMSKTLNSMTDEIYSKCVSSLRSIGEVLSKKGAFGKSFLENIWREFEEDDTHKDVIHIVSCGKNVNVLIGQNNKSIINVEVFDHLPKDTCAKGIEDDYLKLIIHLESASVIDVAQIEKRLLLSLSGEQLHEINKIIGEKFGLQIVVTRRGCVVLVMEKSKPDFNFVQNTDNLKEFLSQLFRVTGFSNEDLSGINISMDITRGDEMDKALFTEFNDMKRGIEIIVRPRKVVESMSEDRKKELVRTIFSEVLDQDDWNIDGEIKIQAEFTTGPTNENKGTIEDIPRRPKPSMKKSGLKGIFCQKKDIPRRPKSSMKKSGLKGVFRYERKKIPITMDVLCMLDTLDFYTNTKTCLGGPINFTLPPPEPPVRKC